ncbi:MAG: caspase family protein [Tannerellaceae bacterium]|nr:caspase family protein [Tannerellaceae bacterium]
MNKYVLIGLLFMYLLPGQQLRAQTGTAFNDAGQQFVMYESARDNGSNPDQMYSYLLSSYNNYRKVAEASDNGQYLDATKRRLRQIYPLLISGFEYYAEKDNPVKAFDFGVAYIETPGMPVLQDTYLGRDGQYTAILYYTAVAAFTQKKNAQAQRYFNEYLNQPDADKEKDAYVYLSMIHQKEKNYRSQEDILEKAISKYPVSLDFYYNLVNVHIATNNMPKLLATINRILEIDPNNDKVLPIKARMMEREGRNQEALEVFQRLYALYPDNFEILTGVARANFNCATEIINQGASIVNDSEYAVIRQRAAGYLINAQDLFLKILQKDPQSTQYMQGLLSVYQYMDMTAEYEVLKKILDEQGNYRDFDSLLATYKATQQNRTIAERTDVGEVPVPVNPALLVIRVDEFADNNNNRLIDAGEGFSIRFTIENQGEGDAYNVRVRLSEQQGLEQYFEGARELDAGIIPAKGSKEFTMRYIAKRDLPTAQAVISLYAFEANGFDAAPVAMNIGTLEYALPRLDVADYQFFATDGSSITRGKNGKLTVALNNMGRVAANKLNIKFTLPDNVYATEAPEINLDSIGAGEVNIVDFSFVVNNRFDKDSILVTMSVSEDTKSSYLNKVFTVKVGEYLTAANTINISSSQTDTPKINTDLSLTYKSELLENIPEGKVMPNRYALIIGNEDYSITGANAEINVPYAINDAQVFREYCVRTFGIPANQIKVLYNATTGMMHEQLSWLSSLASADPEAELFFYFSGHGNNDERTKDPYLIPVDITGRNIHLGISLNDLYNKLAENNPKNAYVFLDACFSGGHKSEAPLVAQKAIRVVPKAGFPRGNTISFSSSSGEQTSSVFHEKKQGYYTYYLIKVLQESGGDITMKELFERASNEVKLATSRMNKIQEPQVSVSPQITTNWENVRLKQ